MSATPHLQIQLLGAPLIKRDGVIQQKIGWQKSLALLGYLTQQENAVSRSKLASLLWIDQPENEARRNLRWALHNLNNLAPDCIEATRHTLHFRPTEKTWIDTHAFTSLLTSGDSVHLAQAADLYRGDFMEGLTLADCPEWELWLLQERQSWRQRIIRLLETLVEQQIETTHYDQAQHFVTRLLALEPWREEAHRRLMWLLAVTEQRSAALTQYKNCRRLLAAELAADPMPETVALYEQIRDGKLDHFRLRILDFRLPEQQPTVERQEAKSQKLKAKILDWGEAPAVTVFYGRQAEMATLRAWLTQETGTPARLVAVLGMGGMGKTALAAKVAHAVSDHFAVVIWRSLLNAPPLAEILQSWVQTLSGQQLATWPNSLDAQLALLFAQLRQQRCLLVLDNVESILQPEGQAGACRPGYEGYEQLFQRMGESAHQSCLLLTSRERPRPFTRLEDGSGAVRSLQLGGLDVAAGRRIMAGRGVTGAQENAATLIARYSGNPLALKLVAETIQELFDGDINAFLGDDTVIFDDIRTVLDQQFARLTTLERSILLWLAVEREPVTEQNLWQNLVGAPARRDFLEALRSLQRRSLLEKIETQLGLQNVVTEYLTEYLIDQICTELHSATPYLAHSHALLKARAKEYVRESQQRTIQQPIATQLLAMLGRTGLEAQAQALLTALRSQQPARPGYLAGNLLNLLLHLGVDLQGYDFSHLAVWQANLQGANLPAVDFRGADLAHCAFTDTFGSILAVAFSPDGRLLAAGTERGEIRLWRLDDSWEGGQPCGLIQEVTETITTLAFSPATGLLASAGGDDKVRLWTISRQEAGAPSAGQLRAVLHGHQGVVKSVAFSPDGAILASTGADHTIRLWDLQRNAPLGEPLVGHTDWVMAVAFSPDGALLASASDDQTVRLWDVAVRQVRHTLVGHTNWVLTLAFSPDGKLLASAGRDQTIYVWDLARGVMQRTLSGHQDWVLALAFSPDGRLLASAGQGQRVRLWRMPGGEPLHTLHRHSNWVRALAFRPAAGDTPPLLASGSTDQTVRLWDGEQGALLQTLQGYTNWIRGVAYSPDGAILASAGIDQMIHLQSSSSGAVCHHLRGHSRGVTAVAYHPDGRLLASSSADRTVRLWDTATGQAVQTLHGHSDVVFTVAFSPDGRWLASGSDDQTIRLWEPQTGRLRATLRGHSEGINALAFHPTSALIASASDDQSIRLWDVAQGQLHATLQGHTGWVRSVAFHPDGELLASGGDEGSVCVWQISTGAIQATYRDHQQRVTCVAFSPDGRTLASAGGDQTIRFWDVATGQARLLLRGHRNIIWSIAFHPNGHALVSSSVDETLKVWETATGVCTQTLRVVGPYAGMLVQGVTGITDAQKSVLKALGALDQP